MKKMFVMLVATVLLTSCDKSMNFSPEVEGYIELVKSGFLGDAGGEMMQHLAEIETLKQEREDFGEKWREKDPKSDAETKRMLEEFGKELDVIEKGIENAENKWNSRAEELKGELVGLEIPTEVADDVPLELIKPVTVTSFNSERIGLEGTIKLTKNRPAIKLRAVNSQADGYYDIKVVLLDNEGTPIDTITPMNVRNMRNSLMKNSFREYDEVKANEELQIEDFISFGSDYFQLFKPTGRTQRILHILSAKKLRIIWEHPFEEKDLLPGRGDLGGYDLRGPVKKVSYSGWSCTFNEQGQLETENGQSLRHIYSGGVTRNKDGRLTECNADAYGSRYYTYNEQGLPTEIAEDGYNRKFTYDADGYVATEKAIMAPDMGDDGEPEVITYKYTIVSKDSYDNWTKRKDQHGNVTTRTITYFE